MVRQAPVICVMAPPIHLGAWSMALMIMYDCLLSFTVHGSNAANSLIKLISFRVFLAATFQF